MKTKMIHPKYVNFVIYCEESMTMLPVRLDVDHLISMFGSCYSKHYDNSVKIKGHNRMSALIITHDRISEIVGIGVFLDIKGDLRFTQKSAIVKMSKEAMNWFITSHKLLLEVMIPNGGMQKSKILVNY